MTLTVYSIYYFHFESLRTQCVPVLNSPSRHRIVVWKTKYQVFPEFKIRVLRYYTYFPVPTPKGVPRKLQFKLPCDDLLFFYDSFFFCPISLIPHSFSSFYVFFFIKFPNFPFNFSLSTESIKIFHHSIRLILRSSVLWYLFSFLSFHG